MRGLDELELFLRSWFALHPKVREVLWYLMVWVGLIYYVFLLFYYALPYHVLLWNDNLSMMNAERLGLQPPPGLVTP